VTALAQNPSGAIVGATDPQTIYVYGTGASGNISLVKSSSSTFTAVGQVLSYNYLVTNDGTISLNEVGVTDQVSGTNAPITVTCPIPTSPTDFLAPGQSETCTAQYTTTSTDATNLGVTNDATASGQDVDFGNQYTASDSKSIAYTP
jgi:uncharacterized repeat protein (TIGR01451 family)